MITNAIAGNHTTLGGSVSANIPVGRDCSDFEAIIQRLISANEASLRINNEFSALCDRLFGALPSSGETSMESVPDGALARCYKLLDTLFSNFSEIEHSAGRLKNIA